MFKQKSNIYFDNASTTPVDPRVQKEMIDVIQGNFGNPSSIHSHGREIKAKVETARKIVANGLKASLSEIFFTSSATEANNTCLIGAVKDLGVERIITSPIEHHCVLHACDFLKLKLKTAIEFVELDSNHKVDLQDLDKKLSAQPNKKTLVSIMHANNEIGVMNEISQIAKLAADHGALYHCDAVQTVGKYALDVSEIPIAFLTGSSHKFYGPKGAGFFYMNKENIINPLLYGGSQERNMRAGTENTYGIIGLGKAFELALEEQGMRHGKTQDLKNYFVKKVLETIPGSRLNGQLEGSHYGIANIGFPKNDLSDILVFNLDIAGISISAGSACSSGIEGDSHVLQAIGASNDYKSLRFSFSHHNTLEEIDFTIDKLQSLINT